MVFEGCLSVSRLLRLAQQSMLCQMNHLEYDNL